MYQLSDTLTDWIEETIGEPVLAVEINNQGWTNLVFEINGCWMARVPKHLTDTEGHTLTNRYALEKQLLDTLSLAIDRDRDCETDQPNCLTAAILPKVHLAPGHIAACMLYPKLAGSPLDWQSPGLRTMSTNTCTSLAAAIGTLLAKLHATELTHLQLVAFPYGDEDFVGSVLPALRPLMGADSYRNAQTYFIKMSETVATQAEVSSRLCHGDFGPANILLGRDYRLSGVLDFSDVCLGDAAMDFAPLWRRSPSEFMHDLLATYREVSGEGHWQSLQPQTLTARIQFHALRKAAFVVWYGKRFGFEDGITGSLNYLKQQFEFQNT
ncbi:phosphotransferase family protein [Shewanella zhangzhouensis]|uniref:phosphotransferase family protein n=1 Tax=Shewanella zhangzhouensis TaxID=2864213 RepID=UPI001C65922A|nr:aminoglycoside phosphotransferase family protein [Shewanella zhangzhouensis]QYK03704.1 aminoglycoside phosphotransferase family protein [Shewanella zhangzhouensis]